jgi:nucleoside-diphosphate-sugar epimerase
VLVAGGAGYIGSVLVPRLLESGYGVRVLDALIYANGDSLSGVLERDGFNFVRGDIRSPSTVERALEGVTDVVLLAALVGDPVCKSNPELARAVNVDGALNLLTAARSAGVERFVFASTCSNYGLREGDDLATEEDELHPLSLYAETKVEMERNLLSGPVEPAATVLRVATAFGISPRMRFDLTVSEFTRELALGHELEVYDADTWRPYCHVADISRAIATVLEAPVDTVAGQVFNAGGEEGNFTKRMIVEAGLAALDGEGSVIWTEGGDDARNYRVSFAKIQSALGFTPEHSVPGSIARLVEAIRAGLFSDADSRALFHGNRELDAATIPAPEEVA